MYREKKTNLFSLEFRLFRWLHDPPRIQRELCPVTGHKKRNHSDKFRVTLDVTGFKPEDLSVKVVGRKLLINGKQEFRDGNFQMIGYELFHIFFVLGEDFSAKEMRKTYEIPENASFEHMTSFLTAKGLCFIL
jgi:HSP20 family molecular chaperone IbpA